MKVDRSTEDLNSICFPYANRRLGRIRDEKIKFAHYTTAATGMKILSGPQIWLRNAAVMNDFSEIKYGIDCLKYSAKEIGLSRRLEGILKDTHPEIIENLRKTIENINKDNNTDMFMFSLCEHADPNDLGKLSMWRAYGGQAAGVCIVIDSTILLNFEKRSDILLSPVLYGSRDEFKDKLKFVIDQLERKHHIVANTPSDQVESILTKVLRSAVLSTKHPGFSEEQEWRLIHLPELAATTGLVASIECINDIPQIVYKMESAGAMTLRVIFDQLLEKIIVGPPSYPFTVKKAFTKVLEQKGVRDAETKVVLSDIPLRQKN